MSRFQILCVTMYQKDFTKIKTMNVNADIIYANQDFVNSYSELHFNSHIAKMITTNTRGVGTNRNIALMYADADVCLFADDDVEYKGDLEQIILDEFDNHKEADIFIFHLSTDDPVRKQKKYKKTRKISLWEQMPWGGFRIAIRLASVRRANVWFSTLFGGGCIFPSGEDSLWLKDAKRKGLVFYVSDKTIGKVSFETSSWFEGRNEKYYYGQGAYARAAHRYFWRLRLIYYSLRTARNSMLTYVERMKWLSNGAKGYLKMLSYDEYMQDNRINEKK